MNKSDRARQGRPAVLAMSLVLVLALLPAGVAFAGAVNTATLDDGTCGHNLQLGSDKTASSSATPWFLLVGDGAGSSYAMKVDGVSIGTFTANAAGHVCISTTTALADGSHTLTGSEVAPHPTLAVTPFAFSVDTVRPLVPPTPRLAPASDTGALGDNVTSVTTPRLYGTSEPRVLVKLYNNIVSPMVLVGSGMADDAGNWSIVIDPSVGLLRIVGFTVDEAGNTSMVPSSYLILNIDTVAPARPPAPALEPASDTAPTGDNTTTITTPKVFGSGGESSLTMAVFVDGVSVGSTRTDLHTNWSYVLPSLANGSHAISVTATDVAGNPSSSSPALMLTIGSGGGATAPAAPSLTSATPGNGQVSLAWTAPTTDGGSPITGYRVTASPGGAVCTTTGGLGCTVGGLTNGTTYAFTATATNAIGTGPASNTLSATPLTVPGAPVLTAATPGSGVVTVAWTAPASNGGSAIAYYTASASPGAFLSCTSSNLGCTISGLANGTTYTITVTATNVAGTGPASNALTATPGTAATAPGAPTLTSATPGSGQVALAWTAPASNGGSAITSYRATASPGGAVCTTTGALGCTVSGLANGTTYAFTVTATNSVGTGPASNALSGTPAAPPGIAPPKLPPTAAMAALAYWRSSTAIALAWSATPGSAAVTGYDVAYRQAPWNGGFGSNITWLTGTGARGATFGGSPGWTYCFSVRAHDALGSVSAWTAETCSAVPLDDRSLSRYGTWTSGSGSAYYKSTYRRSYTSGARLVRASVVARRIAIVATTCSTCGTVRVYWGSTLLKTISLHSSTTVNRRVIPVTTFTKPHNGTITVRTYGSSKVVIDGVAIGRN